MYYMPIWLGYSVSSSFLFQNDSSLYQADIKLAGTAVKTVVYLYCIQIYYTRIFKFCLFEKRSHYGFLSDLGFTTSTRRSSNMWWYCCIRFLNAGIIGM